MDPVCNSSLCLVEQHYVSIFFTRLWSVHTALIWYAQNPEISGFQLHTKRQANVAKMKQHQHSNNNNNKNNNRDLYLNPCVQTIKEWKKIEK